MSLQWTLVAGFLYAEMASIILMMLPFISPTMWKKFFKSRFLRSLAAYSNFYFSAFFVILLLLFMDSIRQMHKYSSLRDLEQEHGHLDAELQQSMKMFRAQRNCYIAGFALFLAPVIRRIGSLLSKQAELSAGVEASLKQAKSASEVAAKLIKEQNEKLEASSVADHTQLVKQEEYENKIQSLRLDLQKAEDELEKTKLNLNSLKSQAEGTNREYDRLSKEHQKLQESIRADGDNSENKED